MKNKKLRIAFDASPLLVNKTGVGYYIERLVANLAQKYPKDIELVGFYYNFIGKRKVAGFPTAPNIHYRPIRLMPGKIIYQLRRWGIEVPVELFIKEKVDFILFPNFLGYPSWRHTPSAPVIHDLTYLDLPQYVAAKNGSDLRRFVPKEIDRSSFVVTVSNFSRDGLVKNYGVDPQDVVVTYIPPQEFKPYSQKECESALKDAGITKPYILFVGTIEPRKNIPSLIDAYQGLPNNIRDKYSLVIAGRIGWNCDKEIERLKLAQNQGLDVHHLGYVDDKTKAVLYQKATIFAHASEYEGFCMPLTEAMSHGVPCCLSDIPVFHEVAGDAALYFNHKNIASITSCLQKALEPNKLKSMGQASSKRAGQFNWDDVSQKLLNAIKQAVSS